MKYLVFIIGLYLSFIACSEIESPTENVLEGENHITSNFKLNEIQAYIAAEDETLRLKSIVSSDVNSDGYSKSWTYKYSKQIESNVVMSKLYYLSSYYDSVHCDSNVVRESTVGDAFISKSWINSDNAMEITENNGGKEFRESNSEYNISASLREAVVPDSNPIWNIRYVSDIDENIFLIIRVNAVTGSLE